MKQRYTGRRSVFGDLKKTQKSSSMFERMFNGVFNYFRGSARGSYDPRANRFVPVFKNGRAKATRHRLAQRDNDIKLYPYKYVVE